MTDNTEGLLPVEYYQWLATIEPDVRVRDLTASETKAMITALHAGASS